MPPSQYLRIPRTDVRTQLSEQIELGVALKTRLNSLFTDRDFAETVRQIRTWEDYLNDLLEHLIASDRMISEFRSAGASIISLSAETGSHHKNYVSHYLDEKIRALESITKRTDLLPVGKQLSVPEDLTNISPGEGKTVFLVHGHDEGLRERVARFLERLDLDVVVLNEKASAGKTLIEKFESYADVAFAVVLLTPDDKGAAVTSTDLRPRARQNVVLELGFFLGRLGRRRVCSLYLEGVELPSDLAGVVYVPLDKEGAWETKLAREMKEAGLTVDMNRAL